MSETTKQTVAATATTSVALLLFSVLPFSEVVEVSIASTAAIISGIVIIMTTTAINAVVRQWALGSFTNSSRSTFVAQVGGDIHW